MYNGQWTYFNSFWFFGVNVSDPVILLIMECDSFNVIKYTEEVSLCKNNNKIIFCNETKK